MLIVRGVSLDRNDIASAHSSSRSPGLALDGLHQKRGDLLAVSFECRFQILRVVVADQLARWAPRACPLQEPSETREYQLMTTISSCSFVAHGPKPSLLSGSVDRLIATPVRPWKHPSAASTIALFSGIPFLT